MCELWIGARRRAVEMSVEKNEKRHVDGNWCNEVTPESHVRKHLLPDTGCHEQVIGEYTERALKGSSFGITFMVFAF